MSDWIDGLDLYNDGVGRILLLGRLGGDKEIVERARKCYQSQDKASPESDLRLLKRLTGGKPLHGTTLRGTVMTFDIRAPLFVVRQATRHIVGHESEGVDVWHTGGGSFDIGGAFDEQSFRYDDTIGFYTPSYIEGEALESWKDMIEDQLYCYNELRAAGLNKQLARCALGPAVYAQYEWTVNLQGLLDFYSKRLPGGGAQKETVELAVAAIRLAHRNVSPIAIEDWFEAEGIDSAVLEW